MSAAPHVFIVAGEDSGDRIGAALIVALEAATQGAARVSGIGGPYMAEAGVTSPFPLGDLAIMGFAAIPRRLPLILRRIRETADAVIAAKPDVLVIIDSPEFTHRVAKRVRARAPEIPVVDYVCPSVWAWRPDRARVMRGYVDRVLALLPFEPETMRRLGGPHCRAAVPARSAAWPPSSVPRPPVSRPRLVRSRSWCRPCRGLPRLCATRSPLGR